MSLEAEVYRYAVFVLRCIDERFRKRLKFENTLSIVDE